jgi:hypothetical protein
VHVLLGGVGMFVLLRRRKLDFGPALLGAASLALGSFMTVRIRHVIFVQAMAWLPWVLYGLDGWLETRSRRQLALAGLAGGMAIVCGALPLAPFFALVIAAYIGPRLARTPGPKRAAAPHHRAHPILAARARRRLRVRVQLRLAQAGLPGHAARARRVRHR